MKTETLEQLMIDRNLGDLSPEVEILLDEFFAREPDLATEMQRIEATLDLARQAFPCQARQTKPRPLPPLKAARPTWSLPPSFLRLAACFAFGLSIGLLLTRKNASPTPAASTPPAPVMALAGSPVSTARPEPQSPGFWSLRNVRFESHRPPEKGQIMISWLSPLNKQATKQKL